MQSPRIKRRKTSHDNAAPRQRPANIVTRQISISSEEESDLNDDTEDSESKDDESNGGKEKPAVTTRPAPFNKPIVKFTSSKDGTHVLPGTNEDSLREATSSSGIFKSNVFKLQVDELLQNVKPRNNGRQPRYMEHLDRLKAAIQTLPARQPLSVQDSIKSLERANTSIPFPHPGPDPASNYKLEYAPPSRIALIGSESIELNTREMAGRDVDVLVEMPSDIFQEKDILNYRYFYRRAYYLAALAAGLKKADSSFSYQYDFLHGNKLLPVLIVTPNKASEKSKARVFSFRILPGLAEDQFPAGKLLPANNCVKSHLTGNSISKNSLASPSYNATLRQDSLYPAYEKVRLLSIEACDAYKDACILGTVWLRQRGYGSQIEKGGFGAFEWSIVIALLLQGGGPRDSPMFSPRYSSFQLFKAALQLLAVRDLVKTPLSVLGPLPALPKDNTTPYLFDAARGMNVLYKMAPWSYKALQLDAKATLTALSDTKSDHFASTFIARTDNPLLKYDFVVIIPASSILDATTATAAHSAIEQRYIEIYDIFTRALTDRVRLINVKRSLQTPWNLDQKMPDIPQEDQVSIEVIFDPVNAQRKIDHGPSAESKAEASKFRRFWGEKAELRRFADGRILETLVWSGKTPRKSIFQEVVEHVVATHLGAAAAKAATYIGGNQIELFKGNTGKGDQGHAAFSSIRDAFRRLGDDLRALEGLPLLVRQIMPADARLSSTSVQIPLQLGTTMAIPANILLQFEGSGRWPDDLAAIERTKTAFLLKVAELLEGHVDGLRARVGLENQHRPFLNGSFLDIAYPSGAAFRMRILHEREQTLRERKLKLPANTQQERAEIAYGLAKYKRNFIREPAHVQAMQSVCSRFEALSSSIRLLKTWFASHLLSPYFAPSLIELFAVRAFLDPAPWITPSSPVTGLLRTLVSLSKWDWRTEPWIVMFGDNPDENTLPTQDTENTNARADVTTIRTRFEAYRKLDPRLDRWVMFVASDLDPDGVTWTDRAMPPKVIASRMTQLARAAVTSINSSSGRSEPDLKLLFEPDMQDYDLIIHLRSQKPSRSSLGDGNEKKAIFKNLQIQQEAVAAREDLGAESYAKLLFEDLRSCFGDALLFFFDEQDEKCIAAIWDPSLESRSWKVKADCSTIPTTNKSAQVAADHVPGTSTAEKPAVLAKVNKDGIVNEIARLGGDLIKSIEVKPL